MEEKIHLDDRGDGRATAYTASGFWKRVPGGPDSPVVWIDMSDDTPEPRDSDIWHVLEHGYQHQETTEPVRRHPRVKPDLKPGLPVYSPTFGFGEIAAIDGHITVAFGGKKRLVARKDLVTQVEAAIDWHNYWLRGEKRRFREGERLFIVKGLCRFGEWQAFLDRYEIPRSSADDLIRRYTDAILPKGQRLQLTGNRSSSAADRSGHGSDLTADPAAELAELVEEETEKRRGEAPTTHPEYWTLRIKLPPRIATRCRERYKEPGAKRYWRDAAYEFVEEEQSSEESTAQECDSDSD